MWRRSRPWGRVPSLVVTMLQEFCEQQGLSVALLFVDSKKAFHAIIRSLVVRIEENDAAVVYLFQQLALFPEALQELKDFFATCAATGRSGINAVAYRDITSTYSACSFIVKGLELVGSTRSPPRQSLRRCCYFVRAPPSLKICSKGS